MTSSLRPERIEVVSAILQVPDGRRRVVPCFCAVLHSEQTLAEIREGVAQLGRTEQLLAEIRDGIANQTSVVAEVREGVAQLREGVAKLSRTEQTLAEIREGVANQTDVLNDKLMKIVEQREEGGASAIGICAPRQ